MATWQDFCAIAPLAGGSELSATAWMFELPGNGDGRTQKVFAFHEVINPDFHVMRVTSAVAHINDVNTTQVLKTFGQLLAGAIGYAPMFDEHDQPADGFLSISTSIPLAAMDLADPKAFLLYLFILARAADDTEQKIASPGLGDTF